MTLVLGYNRRTAAVISELDEYAEPGSRVEVVAADPPDEQAFLGEVGAAGEPDRVPAPCRNERPRRARRARTHATPTGSS